MLNHNLLNQRISGDERDDDWTSDEDDKSQQIDRARIIHSASFRRLQSKTQILGIGDSDFYRTRLTHSMEVAQLGFGISYHLRTKYKADKEKLDLIPTQNMIESICLAHDIGHPAFGHGGEVALNYCMSSHNGFEGNGQTLRIVSKLGEYSQNNGMNLTRRTLLGLIKYPAPFSAYKDQTKYEKKAKYPNLYLPLNLDDYKPPKCFLDTEQEVFDWCTEIFSQKDKKKFMKIGKGKTIYKSFDCSIMELADDISYGLHDLEDAVALRLVTQKQWNKEVLEPIQNIDIELSNLIKTSSNLLFGETNKERKQAISQLIRYFIRQVEIEKNSDFEHDLLCHQAVIKADDKKALEIIKKFVINNVIKQPEIQILDYKGQEMVIKLFEILSNNPKKLLPKSTLEQYHEAIDDNNRQRIICDYIAGMTDSYASKLYHKLFTPNMGSVFDRL